MLQKHSISTMNPGPITAKRVALGIFVMAIALMSNPVFADYDYLVICTGLPDDGLGTLWTAITTDEGHAMTMESHCESQGGEGGIVPIPSEDPER